MFFRSSKINILTYRCYYTRPKVTYNIDRGAMDLNVENQKYIFKRKTRT
jgi:hypothetical protein